jgi:hypothetical protein
MPSGDNRGEASTIETRAEEALHAAERSRARQAGSPRWLAGRLGLLLVTLGAQLVRLGLPSYQPAEK